MKRTTIRHSEVLNRGKWNDVNQHVYAYAEQKDDFLEDYSNVNNFYGMNFGENIRCYAESIDAKGRNRNKIHAHEKSVREEQPEKAKRIRKCNLGHKKWNDRKQQMQGRIETDANYAINQLIKNENLKHFTYENLTQYQPTPGKGAFSRMCNFWMRSILSKRLPFKLQLGGSESTAANPAYSSQTCDWCGFVDRKNRNGDKFHCRWCGRMEHADVIGARSSKARKKDPDIHLWMPKEHVYDVLAKRFESKHGIKLEIAKLQVENGSRKEARRLEGLATASTEFSTIPKINCQPDCSRQDTSAPTTNKSTGSRSTGERRKVVKGQETSRPDDFNNQRVVR